jgi:predicted CoA-binding protein
MENSKTLVLGASVNPERYSNRAIRSLRNHGHNVYAIGLRDGTVNDVKIEKGKPQYNDVDTVTLYMSQRNQEQFYDYILSLHPRRIIYNPGAENPDLEKLAEENNIENLEACTLVLLATGQY